MASDISRPEESFLLNVAQRIRRDGISRSARYAVYRINDSVRLSRFGIRKALEDAMVNVSREEIGLTDNDCHSHAASPSYYMFRQTMRRLVHPTPTDVFLDYGSGLGVALLMAATFPFRRIVGVEYSQALNIVARKKIGAVRGRLACEHIELITANAAEYEVPGDVTVIYFFNPFKGALLDTVVERIGQSLRKVPRTIRIMYYVPGVFESIAAGCDWLVKKGEVTFPAVTPYRTVVYQTTTTRDENGA